MAKTKTQKRNDIVEGTWRELSPEYDIYAPGANAQPTIRMPNQPANRPSALGRLGGAVGAVAGAAAGVFGRLLGGRQGDSHTTNNTTTNNTTVEVTNYAITDSFNTTNNTYEITNHVAQNLIINVDLYGASAMYGDDISLEEMIDVIARRLPNLPAEQRAALLTLPTEELLYVLSLLMRAGEASAPTAQRLGVSLIENVLGMPRTAKHRRMPLLARIGDSFMSQVLGA